MTAVERGARALLERARPVVRERELADRPEFNLFYALGRERDEVHAHSRVIFYLLTAACTREEPEGFLRRFLERLGVPEEHIRKEWTVYRERVIPGGRIDFVLESARFLAAVEMKIDAGDQETQLGRYDAYCRSRNKDYQVCYLTLWGTEPSRQSAAGVDRSRLRLLSFREDISSWLEDCLLLTEPGGFKHAFVKQYLGAVRHLTEEDSGMEELAGLISNREDARAALLVYGSFQRKMEDVITQLMTGLTAVLEEKIAQTVYLTEERLGKFYSASHPFLYTEVDGVRGGGETYRLMAGIGVEPSLFYGFFQFARGEDPADLWWLSLEEAKAAAPGFYGPWMEKIAGLGLPMVRSEKYSKYFTLQNSRGEPIEFRVNGAPNGAALDLIDHLDLEVEYISSFMAEQIRRLLAD